MSRRPPGHALCACLLAVLVLALAGCGADESVEESRIIGDSLTVYSSLPQQGPLAPVSRDLVAAEKLALSEAGGTAGSYAVNYVSLDNADPETGRAERGAVAANARRAIQTPNTIAYLGELEPGASVTSVPILNAGGILQVTPGDTFAPLTEPTRPGTPERFYPSGVPTFARVVPPATDQAADVVAMLRRDGARTLATVPGDRTGLAARVAELAGEAGLDVVGRDERPDAVFAADPGDADLRALRAAHAADPGVRLVGAGGLALRPDLAARLGPAAGRLRVLAVDPGADPDFAGRFTAAYGRVPERHAVLGYRAMRLVLDAIRAAGPDADSRRTVIAAALRRARSPRARIVPMRLRGGRLVSVGSPL